MKKIRYGMAVGNYLPYSETFIYEQIQKGERYSPYVLARGLIPSRNLFPYDDVAALSGITALSYFVWRNSKLFERTINENHLQMIHAHFGSNGALIAPTARRCKVPLVVTYHGVDVGVLLGEKVPLNYLFYKRIYKDAFETADLLLPASEELANCLVDLGAPAHKIKIHRLGVSLDRFRVAPRTEGPVKFIMVGRLVEKKGFDYGIRAFAKISSSVPQASLSIVGEGPLKDQLKALAAELHVESSVHFVGKIPADKMPVYLEQFDALVAPCVVAKNNDRDSGLIVLKEAGATGMASIGTYCGGLPEIIDDGKTGLLVEQRNVDQLADAMLALAENFQYRQKLGLAARAKMETEYDSVIQNAKLEQLFDTVCR
ncbi:glycosyltransferase [Fibrobacter sp. UWEL]|uniref:glycosyltransferase n=1 Tax=Fibrobacter sp. UWEL TaxID=1896209 RepID=UPI00091B34B6|nr:glycosyltransferase [Fibrobacter sp. UWEL]SHK85404.1 Glycosyltransferase involved in cell wall bisynthesis [Fibrobacter sp. UWEL]